MTAPTLSGISVRGMGTEDRGRVLGVRERTGSDFIRSPRLKNLIIVNKTVAIGGRAQLGGVIDEHRSPVCLGRLGGAVLHRAYYLAALGEIGRAHV